MSQQLYRSMSKQLLETVYLLKDKVFGAEQMFIEAIKTQT